jgi:hypothetical protein
MEEGSVMMAGFDLDGVRRGLAILGWRLRNSDHDLRLVWKKY